VYHLDVKSPKANIVDKDTVAAKFSSDGKQVKLSFTTGKDQKYHQAQWYQ
jgi:hypothetical protein